MALAPRFFLFSRAVELDHAVVQRGLIEGVHAAQLVGQLVVDVLDGLQDPLAEVFRLVAVAKFPGLVDAGAGAAGHGGPAERAVGQPTSTSTVGLPRLSRICRAWMSTICELMAFLTLTRHLER